MSDAVPPMTVSEVMAEIALFWADPYAYHANVLLKAEIARLRSRYSSSSKAERALLKERIGELRGAT